MARSFGNQSVHGQRNQLGGRAAICSGNPFQLVSLLPGKAKFLRLHMACCATTSHDSQQNSSCVCSATNYNVPQLIAAVINPTLNVRFTEAQLAALREIAQKNSVNVAHLVRWAVDGLIRHVERNEGRLVLPIEYSEPKKPA